VRAKRDVAGSNLVTGSKQTLAVTVPEPGGGGDAVRREASAASFSGGASLRARMKRRRSGRIQPAHPRWSSGRIEGQAARCAWTPSDFARPGPAVAPTSTPRSSRWRRKGSAERAGEPGTAAGAGKNAPAPPARGRRRPQARSRPTEDGRASSRSPGCQSWPATSSEGSPDQRELDSSTPDWTLEPRTFSPDGRRVVGDGVRGARAEQCRARTAVHRKRGLDSSRSPEPRWQNRKMRSSRAAAGHRDGKGRPCSRRVVSPPGTTPPLPRTNSDAGGRNGKAR